MVRICNDCGREYEWLEGEIYGLSYCHPADAPEYASTCYTRALQNWRKWPK
jgi:hypothetical protein